MSAEVADVVVVGLGPAGSCAAAAAAAAGARVIAIEARAAAGMPVQCAEFVPALLDQEIPGLGAVTVQPIARMLNHVEAAPPDETASFPGRMIDRARFDRMLAGRAAAAGAQCRFGRRLAGVDGTGVLHMTDGGTLRAGAVIGADGPRSRVGAATGRVNAALVETRQVTVALHQRHDATDIFLRAAYPGGYGWLFPKGRLANLGLGLAAPARARLRPLLGALHAELAAAGRVGAAVCGLTGGAIPVGGRLPAVRRIGGVPALLAGDAAGLANPVTGAGIAAAVQSGTLAGAAAASWLGGSPAALDDYEDDLADTFDAALGRARTRRAALLAASPGPPAPAALRAGWIGYPQYWAAAAPACLEEAA
jgi:digeranylgeranylglycerophospholipid reductase